MIHEIKVKLEELNDMVGRADSAAEKFVFSSKGAATMIALAIIGAGLMTLKTLLVHQ